MTLEELEKKLQEQAHDLGGGWRIESRRMPVIVLTMEEAERLINRLKEKVMAYDSRPDTYAHIATVQANLMKVVWGLMQRAHKHDQSKLEEPEKSVFDVVTPKLKELTYDSPEYKASLVEMGEALAHHYQVNDHHPEHFPKYGIAEMDLLQVTEMLCDWKAATLRHTNGDLRRSIEQNADRFGYGVEMKGLLMNTAENMGWL